MSPTLRSNNGKPPDKAKPFVKWAGGKGNLLAQLEQALPSNFDQLPNVTYIEPFVGGGAMLFHMLQKHNNIQRAVINDINGDLVHCYRLIRKSPNILIRHLRVLEGDFYRLPVSERQNRYYEWRDEFNAQALSSDRRAALFIFLNRTCYNGLFRVNTTGNFNVPYGRYAHPIICDAERIMNAHALLSKRNVKIMRAGTYQRIQNELGIDGTNFIYFDPPYRPVSQTSYFKGYSNSPFEDRQQEELKEFCDQMSDLQCLIMLSNSDSKKDGQSYFEALFHGYRCTKVHAPRSINAYSSQRASQTEVLIRNYN